MGNTQFDSMVINDLENGKVDPNFANESFLSRNIHLLSENVLDLLSEYHHVCFHENFLQSHMNYSWNWKKLSKPNYRGQWFSANFINSESEYAFWDLEELRNHPNAEEIFKK